MNTRQESPAALRNREPIREVLQQWLPEGHVLEVPCGTGVHAAYLSKAFPDRIWQPADLSEEALESTRGWLADGGPNLLDPVRLDVTELPWNVPRLDAVVCINLIHAAPPEVTPGLIRGAARALRPGGVLYLYGPYREGGVTAPSNEIFEREYLKMRDPSWGLRDLEAVDALAREAGFDRVARVEMPANNLSVVFVRRAGDPPSLPGVE